MQETPHVERLGAQGIVRKGLPKTFPSSATGKTNRDNSAARMARIKADTLAWLVGLPMARDGFRRAPWREGAALQRISNNDLGQAVAALEREGALRRELRTAPRRGFRETWVQLAADARAQDGQPAAAPTSAACKVVRWRESEETILRAMAGEGATLAAIADRLGRCVTSVRGKAQRLNIALGTRCMPHGRSVPRWSAAEDEALAELAAQGKSSGQIALEIGRSSNAVQSRAARLEIALLARPQMAKPPAARLVPCEPSPTVAAQRMAADLRAVAKRLQQDSVALHLWRLAETTGLSEQLVRRALAHLPRHGIDWRAPVGQGGGHRFRLRAQRAMAGAA